jgi:hypothetical protein
VDDRLRPASGDDYVKSGLRRASRPEVRVSGSMRPRLECRYEDPAVPASECFRQLRGDIPYWLLKARLK